jgi:endonuclease-3 related protein
MTATPRGVHDELYAHYGPQHWWPGESPFEVMVGAILTQNTAWTNVEKAIAALAAADCLDPEAIAALPHERLAAWLRPVGYFNVKARRLKAFCAWYRQAGALEALNALPTAELRRALLAVHGVGPETADDMLLYAFERPVFVIDAYTRRLFGRLGLVDESAGYEHLRAWFEQALGPDTALYNECHALIVRHAKHVCRPRPRCAQCVLTPICPYP